MGGPPVGESSQQRRKTRKVERFDNLIWDRARTRQLFDFHYGIEIYVPKAKRQYGYFVLSILHGDRLIGRIDPVMDRKRARLTINAIHFEPSAPATKASVKALRRSIEELGSFLGVKEIVNNG